MVRLSGKQNAMVLKFFTSDSCLTDFRQKKTAFAKAAWGGLNLTLKKRILVP